MDKQGWVGLTSEEDRGDGNEVQCHCDRSESGIRSTSLVDHFLLLLRVKALELVISLMITRSGLHSIITYSSKPQSAPARNNERKGNAPRKKTVPTTGIKFNGNVNTYRMIPSVESLLERGFVMARPSWVAFPPLDLEEGLRRRPFWTRSVWFRARRTYGERIALACYENSGMRIGEIGEKDEDVQHQTNQHPLVR
jgi:hypothetical protein